MKIEKVLQRDKQRLVQEAVRAKFPRNNMYVLELDEDKNEAYLEEYSSESGEYSLFVVSYSAKDDFSEVEITSEKVSVVQTTTYVQVDDGVSNTTIVENNKDESFIKRVVKGVLDALSPIDNVIRIPQLDESNEQMIEISQMYCSPLVEDAHGEAMTAEDILAMVESFNEVLGRGGIQMKVDHEDAIEGVYPVKAFIAEFDMELLTPEGVVRIPEGTPLVKLQYTDPVLWAERKSGVFTGISIGAVYKYEEDAILEWD